MASITSTLGSAEKSLSIGVGNGASLGRRMGDDGDMVGGGVSVSSNSRPCPSALNIHVLVVGEESRLDWGFGQIIALAYLVNEIRAPTM
jgi:hypothetical protein